MRLAFVAIALIMFIALAEARPARIVVNAPIFKPNAVILCPWVAWSVAPDTPNGSPSLGICPNRQTLDYCAATGKFCFDGR